MNKMGKNKLSICVFCGSSSGNSPVYQEAAKDLGTLIGQRNFRLIYGGGHIGLMGGVADATLQVGGEVIGVIPKSLMTKEEGYQRVTELRVVDSMHERKAIMERLSDVVVALPGGFGTLDELNEIITWRQLSFHQMPIYLLNINGYYDQFLGFLKTAVAEGFISLAHLDYLVVCDSVQDLNHHLSLLSVPLES